MSRYWVGNRLKRGAPATFKTSGAETASTTHSTVHTGKNTVAAVKVDVTAASGTGPTLVVVVEGSSDETNWVEVGRIGTDYRVGTVGSVTAFSAVADTTGVFPAMEFMRTRSIVGGTTPSFTFSVTGELS
ncbi:hypothetical protein GCM10012275_28320 [Longimycelium tulufanense]|uniref:Uncharacterized protein n=1 Tax=Longimycelium tulufanense TaxID=907463 RepID=A0A8J3FUJ1_9PSEU|nr:hypothetical protein [Longimycelium tulufanense]GGM55545.1 hypothetical protein GCM10012275_28320 [Longimycelium tulufanense]